MDTALWELPGQVEKRQTNELWLGSTEAGATCTEGSGQMDGIQEGFLEEVTPVLNLTDK